MFRVGELRNQVFNETRVQHIGMQQMGKSIRVLIFQFSTCAKKSSYQEMYHSFIETLVCARALVLNVVCRLIGNNAK